MSLKLSVGLYISVPELPKPVLKRSNMKVDMHKIGYAYAHTIEYPLVAPSWDLGAPAPGVHGYFFKALVKMAIGPLILSADMLDFISIISVR